MAIAKFEFQLQHDRILNPLHGSIATLKSPTQLLKNRLDPSPTAASHRIPRAFIHPRPTYNGCILPRPTPGTPAFTGWDVRAQTRLGRPVWWCKVDKVVIFDGMVETGDGSVEYRTRSGKGLRVARRSGMRRPDCLH
ncbi:hypothetical protein M011DRAFT_468240 [Sporormia fimetaria CBS 119925]|uniref:Uncharacterized protein n=1 Tax=Sporormia fimetaria CBS 119925 TaxID=1340428 RepID=A0A6A6VB40_9PLEO|nr:hypothetical protein M011DRAFT_468240 [Sporormia fimetaria CBS 119925]